MCQNFPPPWIIWQCCTRLARSLQVQPFLIGSTANFFLKITVYIKIGCASGSGCTVIQRSNSDKQEYQSIYYLARSKDRLLNILLKLFYFRCTRTHWKSFTRHPTWRCYSTYPGPTTKLASSGRPNPPSWELEELLLRYFEDFFSLIMTDFLYEMRHFLFYISSNTYF